MKLQRRLQSICFCKLLSRTEKRTGIFADLTVQELKEAKKEQGGFVILLLVDEGKTFRVYGGAGIFLSKDEHSLLVEFVEKCRPLFCPQTNQLFCRTSGKRSTVKDIHDFLQESWDDFATKENRDLGQLTCSLLRKTLVSRSWKAGLERSEQEEMDRHMDHSIFTADHHYDVNTGIRITAKFRQIIEKFKETDLPSESDYDDLTAEDLVVDNQVGVQDLSGETPVFESVAVASLDGKAATVGSFLPDHDGQPSCKSFNFKFGREVILAEENTVL